MLTSNYIIKKLRKKIFIIQHFFVVVTCIIFCTKKQIASTAPNVINTNLAYATKNLNTNEVQLAYKHVINEHLNH